MDGIQEAKILLKLGDPEATGGLSRSVRLTVCTHAYITTFIDLHFALEAVQGAECSKTRDGWLSEQLNREDRDTLK